MGSWQNYKYNGKELQTSGMYDYGARFYMPDVGIFGQHDPLSEKIGTPYAYVYNNPIRFIDPTGMIAIPPEDSGGYKAEEVWTDSDGSWTRTSGGWKNNDKNGESYIDEVVVTGKKMKVM